MDVPYFTAWIKPGADAMTSTSLASRRGLAGTPGFMIAADGLAASDRQATTIMNWAW
jgi:hypothetical protein